MASATVSLMTFVDQKKHAAVMRTTQLKVVVWDAILKSDEVLPGLTDEDLAVAFTEMLLEVTVNMRKNRLDSENKAE